MQKWSAYKLPNKLISNVKENFTMIPLLHYLEKNGSHLENFSCCVGAASGRDSCLCVCATATPLCRYILGTLRCDSSELRAVSLTLLSSSPSRTYVRSSSSSLIGLRMYRISVLRGPERNSYSLLQHKTIFDDFEYI